MRYRLLNLVLIEVQEYGNYEKLRTYLKRNINDLLDIVDLLGKHYSKCNC